MSRVVSIPALYSEGWYDQRSVILVGGFVVSVGFYRQTLGCMQTFISLFSFLKEDCRLMKSQTCLRICPLIKFSAKW
jgi:hypothetical protein